MSLEHDWSEDTERAAEQLAAGEAIDLPDGAHDEEGKRVVAGLRALRDLLVATPDEQALLEGDALPQPVLPEGYQVMAQIGRGGMGVVYRATRLEDGRAVAIKVLHPAQALFGESIQRFRREATTLAKLEHPNIVKVYEVAEHRGQVYLVMECVEGRSLDEILASDGALTPKRAVHIVQQVTRAVAHVHEHGVVHRDLKPGNVLIDDQDHVYVTDFGLAFEIGSDTGLTLTGQVLGTPAYMSPEQARGDAEGVDERGDVYALGVMLYECLTGQRPFEGLSPPEQVYAVLHTVPTPPRALRRSIPRDLQTICQTAMQKRKEARYATADALLSDLDRFAAQRPIQARRPSWSDRTKRFASRNRAALIWGSTVLAVALTGWSLLKSQRADASNQLLRAADALLESGQHAAAIRSYEHVAQSDGDFSVRADRGQVMARVHQARELWYADKHDEARAALGAARPIASRSASYTSGFVDWTGAVFDALATDDLTQTLSDPKSPILQRLREVLTPWRDQLRRRRAADLLSGNVDFSSDAVPLALFRALRKPLQTPDSPAGRAALDEARCFATAQGLRGSHVLNAHQVLAKDTPRGFIEVGLAMVDSPRGKRPARKFGHYILALLKGHPKVVEQALVETIQGTSSVSIRKTAAQLLAFHLDLPFGFAIPYVDVNESSVDEDRVLAIRRQLNEASREQALRVRIELAVSEIERARSSVFVTTHLSSWLRDTIGGNHLSPAGVLAWWKAHRQKAPIEWVTEALKPRTVEWSRVSTILEQWAATQAPDTRELGKHNEYDTLLRLLAPSDMTVPHRTLSPRGLLEKWRTLLQPTANQARLRIGIVQMRNGRWYATPEDEQLLTIDVTPTASGTYQLVMPSRGAIRSSRFVISTGSRKAVDSHTGRVNSHAATGQEFTFEVTGPHPESQNWASSLADAAQRAARQQRFVSSLDLGSAVWTRRERFRNHLALVAAEAPDAATQPWTFDEWRRAIDASLRQLADGLAPEGVDLRVLLRGSDPRANDEQQQAMRYAVERYAFDHHDSLGDIAAIACRIPLPDSRVALARIARALTIFSKHDQSDTGVSAPLDAQASIFEMARLLAGDESSLGGPDRFQFPSVHSVASSIIGPEGEGAVRLLRLTKSERIRTFALDHLKSIDIGARATDDLRDGVRNDGLKLPDWLMQRVESGPTEVRTWWTELKQHPGWLAGLSILALLSLLALWLALRPGRTEAQRVVPASWLVVLGSLILGMIQVELLGTDIPIGAVGLGMAAIGAWVLARAMSCAPWAAALFATMVALDVAFPDPMPNLVKVLGGTALILALTDIVRLARHMRGRTPIRPPLWFLLGFTLPGLLFMLYSAYEGKTMHTSHGPTTTWQDVGLGLALLWGLFFMFCWFNAHAQILDAARVRRAWRQVRAPDSRPM